MLKREFVHAIGALAVASLIGALWVTGFPPRRMNQQAVLSDTLARAGLQGMAADEYVVRDFRHFEALYRVQLTPDEFRRLTIVARSDVIQGTAPPTRLFPYWWPKSEATSYDVRVTPGFNTNAAVDGEHYLLAYDKSSYECYIWLQFKS